MIMWFVLINLPSLKALAGKEGGEMKIKNLGFTLIELLVVISIIGILASLTLVSYSGAQKQTRDTQRKSDLGQYRNALENYAAANNGLYPLLQTADKISSICPSPLSTNFIASCPDDPFATATPARHYYYQSSADLTKYILYADLETVGFWYVCSTGKTATKDTTPGIGDCP